MRAFTTILFLLIASPAIFAADRQSLSGQVPAVVQALQLQPVGSLVATQRLHLAIGLPLRHRDVLTNLLQSLYDPASPGYHHYLKPAEFLDQFGPTAADFAAVVAFATTNGWTVTRQDPGRQIVDVSATVADVQRVAHVKMRVYQHPTEARTFFAPDQEPSLDLSTPVLDICGMDNYVLPHPCNLHPDHRSSEQPATGSGPQGNLMGYDFRTAYAPGVTLDGTGQTVGLLEFDGFYASDISSYESDAGLPYVPITVEPVDYFDENPSTNESSVSEVSLDIEMAIAMAPGLSQVIVYEAAAGESLSVDILSQMAGDDTAAQLSSSWSFSENTTKDDYLQQMAAQGQSFFQASGDDNAYVNGINIVSHGGPPSDDAYLTSVGGTVLTLNPQGGWQSETVWNQNFTGYGTGGSGGGISTRYAIPVWQQGTSMAKNGGSTTMRNIPDVAMAADNIWVEYNNGESSAFDGTSCAAPLWAGFTALINQQAAILGNAPVGFVNPAIYSLGNSPGYAAAFNDIITGNNTSSSSPHLFYAVPGYDLCTGWGTPSGLNLINALTLTDPLSIAPANGFAASGSVGGPFTPAQQTFYLTNPGASPLAWSATTVSSLLDISPASGVLPAAGATNVTVTLDDSAASLPLGLYSASLLFSNLTLGTAQLRPFSVQAGPPTVTFDDLPGSGNPLPDGYGGVNWSNLFYLNPNNANNPSGYPVDLVSPPNVVYNGGGSQARILSATPFDFVSAVMTAAWRNGLKVKVQGYVGTGRLYDRVVTLSTTAQTVVPFNDYGVTSVVFLPSGGIAVSGYAESGYQFAMDNVVINPQNAPTPPAVAIISPASGQPISNPVCTVSGVAGDAWRLGGVFYSFNGGPWTAAVTTNQWTNWTATVALLPSANSFSVYAVDAYGNPSPTVTASLFLALTSQLQVRTIGLATLSPNDSNAWLNIGQSYTLKAIPAPGFSFTSWTISTNWLGGTVTSNPAVQFTMATNLTLTASLVDTQKPALSITTPTAGQRVSNPVYTVTGTASDNWQVASVWLQLNGGGWNLANGTNNWSATVNLSAGTNVVQAYAVDNSGNHSLTNLVTFECVITNHLGVAFNGLATLSPNDTNVSLEIGRNYALTAFPAVGFNFTSWTTSTNWMGGTVTNKPTVQFMMASNLTLTASLVDTQKPALSITTPTAGQRVSNPVYTVTGTASDNWQVASVWLQLNGGGWNLANGTNNWSATVNLSAGTNVVQAYAVDNSGNHSLTNLVTFDCVITNHLGVAFNGLAALSPNDTNAWLEIGRNYSLTAIPAAGFSFTSWTVATNWLGGNVTNKPTVQFMMASNLTLAVTLVDTQKPALTITTPTTGQRVSNPVYTVIGTASDNWQVATVWLQLNGGGWNLANGTNNWSATVNLSAGTNVVQAYAVDNSGNHSLTNLVTFDCVVTNQLGVRFFGLGTLSPNYSNTWLELGRNYSLTATPATGFVFTNWTISTNWLGGVVTNKPTVQFMMASNLTLTAAFLETTRPVVTITNLATGQKLNHTVVAVQGTASDNWQVTQVWCQLNSNAWLLAATTNNFKNWSATNLPLSFGTNVIRFYAGNLGGDYSTTNNLAVIATNAALRNLVMAATRFISLPPEVVITAAPLTAGGLSFNLEISGAAAGSVEVSTNLRSWTTLKTFAGTNTTLTFSDPAATNSSQRFYRAVSP